MGPKSFIISVGLLLLFSNVCAQKTKGTLFFNDGTVKEGLVRLASGAKVKFRPNKKTKAVKYEFSELVKVEILDDEEPTVYVQILARGQNGPKIVKEVIKGPISLYHLHTAGTAPVMMPNGVHGGSMMFMGSYNIKNLYVLRKGEKVATHLGSNQLFTKNFKKAASEFFKDCPDLAEKIQKREYKKKDIEQIVAFYNNECQ